MGLVRFSGYRVPDTRSQVPGTRYWELILEFGPGDSPHNNVDMVLGREAVRAIMKKDWESRGGARACASYTACGYAALLSAGCFGHLCYTLIVSKPNLSAKLVGKY